MNIFDKYAKYPKKEIYNIYESIVSSVKEIDEISKKEMLESIIEEYKKEYHLYYLCTHSELDFLNKLFNNEINSKNKKEYKWEINELSRKAIIDKKTLEIYDFQLDNINKSLAYYKENGVDFLEDIVKILIGIVRTYLMLTIDDLYTIIHSLIGLSKNDLKDLESHPLFRFYCGIIIDEDKDIIFYKNYFNYIDEYIKLKKTKKFIYNPNLDYQDYLDMFRYGFNIKNPKVFKMYECIKNNNKLYKVTEYARLFDNREGINSLIINEGLDNSLIAIYNGFPKQDNK